MKNILKLVNEEDIKNYVGSLWKTNDFKEAHKDQNSFISKWINEFSKRPRLFFEMDDEVNEKGHFTSWMNCVSIRTYPNDAISDLYYLHEIIHCTTMPYSSIQDLNAWKQKMFDNELLASLNSEVLVYFHLPQLRSKSFTFPIWADSHLSTKNLDFKSDGFYKLLETERRRIYNHPKLDNNPELEIAKYQAQNEKWITIWENSYPTIENFMANFNQLSLISKEDASLLHFNWINGLIQLGGKSYPFPDEAEAFAKAYWNNKK
jgi:hypothetical protein